jgi:hypothetical protein
MTVKFHSRTPSLFQDCTSLLASFGLTAESGLKHLQGTRAAGNEHSVMTDGTSLANGHLAVPNKNN